MRKTARRERATVRRRKLEPRVLEGVRHFVRVLCRCGSAPEEVTRAVLEASRSIPKEWFSNAAFSAPDLDTVGRLVTLWFSDARYLDARGDPRPLSLTGERSLEQLARTLGVDLNLEAPERHPLLMGALKRVRGGYVPRERMVVLRGTGLTHPDGLRGLFGLLKTLDHNRARARNAPVRFQVFSCNDNFPVSARAQFEQRSGESCRRLVYQLDGRMHRRERSRTPGERTVTLGVGFYFFEEPSRGYPRQRALSRRRK